MNLENSFPNIDAVFINCALASIGAIFVCAYVAKELIFRLKKCVKTIDQQIPIPGISKIEIEAATGEHRNFWLVISFAHGRNALNGSIVIASPTHSPVIFDLPVLNGDHEKIRSTIPLDVRIKLPGALLVSGFVLQFDLNWNISKKWIKRWYGISEEMEHVNLKLIA